MNTWLIITGLWLCATLAAFAALLWRLPKAYIRGLILDGILYWTFVAIAALPALLNAWRQP